MHVGVVGVSVAFLLGGSGGAVWVGQFSKPGAPPAPWHMVKMSSARPTAYRVAMVQGRAAIEADVDKSMSLMARPIRVDLSKTPVLCWRWYVSGPVRNADMTRKSGDDYAARVYVAFDVDDSAMSGSTKFKLRMARGLFGKELPDAAVVYVWDNRHALGTARKSSYTDRSQLIVAETGAGRAGSWVSERADLASDFAKAFPNQPGTPTQIAVAADGDNTKSSGHAAFADIHFVARNQQCDL
ncbi:DUF3047 domain-containing protein [Sphingomonas hankyongi]|uniref:DUF3047 domain-containing protein n=1 Tax=Sphingomonas hankyongi TaxID=2908209 RepID=A0ABT0S2C2_9SPHN|nr:DUF3047 domain-containing protein [Sphingomonas hankyongi]MCL6730015.1 DUF3047 domain-containing protein [Sphingomonas hankyongi]